MKPIVILGVFVADLTFRNDRMPVKGQTLIGKSFKLGPGGKGSNQVIAARRAGAEVHFIAMLGKDHLMFSSMLYLLELHPRSKGTHRVFLSSFLYLTLDR